MHQANSRQSPPSLSERGRKSHEKAQPVVSARWWAKKNVRRKNARKVRALSRCPHFVHFSLDVSYVRNFSVYGSP